MRASKFNILITPEETPGRAILYNTFHDHRLVIETPHERIREFFRKVAVREGLEPNETETARTFLDLGILLPDDTDERAIFDAWYAGKVQNAEKRLALIIVTTMACNLRCPYCFEKDSLDNARHMTAETADRLVAWIKKQAVAKGIEELDVMFFGGEPLMNKRVLLRIASALKDFSADHGPRYTSGMITNGVLLTRETARELRKVGLDWVKVTLDGERQVHDTTRITASGRGSFDRILANLEGLNVDLAPGEEAIKILIGGNFKDDTYGGFPPLLDRLARASFRPFITQINLKPVMETATGKEGLESENPCDKVCFNEQNTARMIALRGEMIRRGLTPVDGLNLGPCDFYRGDSFTVGLDGSLYPCIAFVDAPQSAVGNVFEETPSMEHLRTRNRWTQARPWSESCYACAFLPVCTGGCRAVAYHEGRSWNATVCEKDYFRRISKALALELLGVEETEETAGEALVAGACNAANVGTESLPLRSPLRPLPPQPPPAFTP